MDRLATDEQVQEAEAQVQERNFHNPEKHFEWWECIETLPGDCTLPRKQRRPNDGGRKCSSHPSARRIHSNFMPEYRHAHLDLLEAEERDKELFKIALADIDPVVKLPDRFVRVERQRWEMQTCRWSQTRAYLGSEGREPVDRWEFAAVYCDEDWSNIQQRLITHEAMRKIGLGTSFGTPIVYLKMEYDVLPELGHHPSSFQAGRQWKRKFDECLSSVLYELGGSVPSYSLSLESTTRTTLDSQTGSVIGTSPLAYPNDSRHHGPSRDVAAVELERSIAYEQRFEAARSFDLDDDLDFCPLSMFDEQTRICAPSFS